MSDKKELKNLKVLRGIRVDGKAYPTGSIIPKSLFKKEGDWKNILHMSKPRVEETSEAVRGREPEKKLPGAN
jgi:hypothetical protein